MILQVFSTLNDSMIPWDLHVQSTPSSVPSIVLNVSLMTSLDFCLTRVRPGLLIEDKCFSWSIHHNLALSNDVFHHHFNCNISLSVFLVKVKSLLLLIVLYDRQGVSHAALAASAMAFLGPDTFPVHSSNKMNLQHKHLQTSPWKMRRRQPAMWQSRQRSCHSPRLSIAPSRRKQCHSGGLVLALSGWRQKLPALLRLRVAEAKPKRLTIYKNKVTLFPILIFHCLGCSAGRQFHEDTVW